MNQQDECPDFNYCVQKIVQILSFEFYLSGRRANGGTIIFLRSASISVTVLLITIFLNNWIDKNLQLPIAFDNFRTQLIQLAPWFAALFAGSYVALYSRFSSQWSYLANLYNMIKQAEITVCGTSTENERKAQEEIIWQWKAGYIEDALELHLAGKSNVAAIIKAWGGVSQVEKEFRENTFNGNRRWEELMINVNAVSQRHS